MNDPWWSPASLAKRRGNLALRGRAKSALSEWFQSAGFIEVETPALQISPGLEPHLAAFETRLVPAGHYGHAEAGQPYYLHTSPEFAMKKLLAGGMEKIWQLCPVYRNAEGSPTHSPEFKMLEWYRAQAGYEELMSDAQTLIRALATACQVSSLRRGDRHSDPMGPFLRLTVAEAFAEYCGHDLTATISENPQSPPVAPLIETANRLGIRVAGGDSFDDVFFRLMDARIEPHLGDGVPCFLIDYPISMAALARPKPDNPIWAERVELYACGVELANGFGELTDADEQRRRFQADMDLKQQLYGHRYPIDEDFLAAVAAMPPAAGMALGFDRLVMLLAGADRLDDVLWARVSS